MCIGTQPCVQGAEGPVAAAVKSVCASMSGRAVAVEPIDTWMEDCKADESPAYPHEAREARSAAHSGAGTVTTEDTDMQKTFIVDEAVTATLSALESTTPPWAVRGPSGRTYDSTSLCSLRPADQPRRAAILFLENTWFEPLVLATILANCITLAWESPLDPQDTPKAAFIGVCEWVYLFIFTFELMTKVLAYGFALHGTAYLRDPWCQLDFVVVTLAWLPIIFPAFGNYSAIRSVRALRPLRALKRLPGMPVLIGSILSAIPKLATVAALCCFIFVVFGVVGVELFKGTLHYRCALPGFVDANGHGRSLMQPDAWDGSGGSGAWLHGVSGASTLAVKPQSTTTAASRTISEFASGMPSSASAGLDTLASHTMRMLRGGGGRSGEVGNDNDAQGVFDTGIICNRRLPTQCEQGTQCKYFELNLQANLMSFDSVAVAFIVILQVCPACQMPGAHGEEEAWSQTHAFLRPVVACALLWCPGHHI